MNCVGTLVGKYGFLQISAESDTNMGRHGCTCWQCEDEPNIRQWVNLSHDLHTSYHLDCSTGQDHDALFSVRVRGVAQNLFWINAIRSFLLQGSGAEGINLFGDFLTEETTSTTESSTERRNQENSRTSISSIFVFLRNLQLSHYWKHPLSMREISHRSSLGS